MKTRFHTLKIVIFALLAAALFAAIFFLMALDSFNIEKHSDYLYSITCKNYNYSTAEKIVQSSPVSLATGACSAVRSGDLMGRNFDWLYDDDTDFVVKVPSAEGRYSSIGIASTTGIKNITPDKVRFSIFYYFIPFYTVDGINEKGLCVSVNEVPSGDAGVTTGTNPGADRLCSVIACRYLLDYAGSVDEAVRLLSEKDIYKGF